MLMLFVAFAVPRLACAQYDPNTPGKVPPKQYSIVVNVNPNPPWGGYAGQYSPYHYHNYGYGYYSRPALPYYAAPPLLFPPTVMSTQGMYGPSGLAGIAGPMNVPATVLLPELPNDDAQAEPRKNVPPVNASSRAQADRMIEQADAKLRQGDLSAAAAKYHSVRDVAPNYPKAAIREGIARAAQGYYEAAGWSLRRAIFLKRDLKDLDVRLENLLGKEGAESLVEKMSQELEAQPDSLWLCLTLGTCLVLDGKVEKGGVLLEHYDQLGGNRDGVLSELLTRIGQAPPAKNEF
jgi:hypothetical protein